MTFKVEKSWVTEAGLPAVVIWANDSHRCGYVELTKDSIFYGITNESEVQPIAQKNIDDLDVHGGVTFFNKPYWTDSTTKNSNFFVGFDCAHAGDATRYFPAEGVLRSLDYCIEECERLADQLMTTFEEPLPHWAIGRCNGDYVLGAQLPTRDGRRCGNAHIVEAVEVCLGMNKLIYTVLTDAGTCMHLTASEIDELFHSPMWVSSVEEVIRKFGSNATGLRGAEIRTNDSKPVEQPIGHDWDDQDKCRRCGDRDWYASPTCTPAQQGHVHAELMAQYAEDAKSTDKPWELWECRQKGFEWHNLEDHPRWLTQLEYRRKTKTHIVNGVEIPDLRIKDFNEGSLDGDCIGYCVDPLDDELCGDHYPVRPDTTKKFLEFGLLYEYTEEGKQAAILHSKAWLGIA